MQLLRSYEWMCGYIAEPEAFEVRDGPGKPLTVLDRYIEAYFRALVVPDFPDIDVIKTEDITPSFNLDKRGRFCMAIDILDGAHLQHRQLSNWCSAVIIFDRLEPKIYGAYIAFPAIEKFYFATAETAGAYSRNVPGLSRIESRPCEDLDLIRGQAGGWNRIRVRLPAGSTKLDCATMSIYAQRCSELLLLQSDERYGRLRSWLKELGSIQGQARGSEPVLRILNLGGNPMLVRLCDGGPDLVLELAGATPNDWIPGAYIAIKAGAFIGLTDGSLLTTDDLCAKLTGDWLRTPYVASVNRGIYDEITTLLRPMRQTATF